MWRQDTGTALRGGLQHRHADRQGKPAQRHTMCSTAPTCRTKMDARSGHMDRAVQNKALYNHPDLVYQPCSYLRATRETPPGQQAGAQ
jgi:hypothetical protein